MKVIYWLGALATVAAISACEKKAELEITDGTPREKSTQQLKISEDPTDGRYNTVEAINPKSNKVQKKFYYTPKRNVWINFGGQGLSGIDCDLSNVSTSIALLTYDNDTLISSRRLDITSPDILLEKAYSYVVRASMVGVRGCRSAYLSFTLNRVD